MDEELEAQGKSGTTDTAAKMRAKWKAHQAAHDTLKAERDSVSKKLVHAKKNQTKHKAVLKATGKNTDERVTKLTGEGLRHFLRRPSSERLEGHDRDAEELARDSTKPSQQAQRPTC